MVARPRNHLNQAVTSPPVWVNLRLRSFGRAQSASPERSDLYGLSGATPEDLARRDNAAIAQVSCLLPANAAEAVLGAEFVAAHAQAMDCLRLARNPGWLSPSS